MIKHFFLFLLALATPALLSAQWKPAGERIRTTWGEKLNPQQVLPEYPRPILERPDWQNLNGLWNYAITSVGASAPTTYDGEILVPFPVESSLSGVGRLLGEKNELWYQRTFLVPAQWKAERVLLHFGAVDWKADVWVNDIKVGQHTGGFTPFSFDTSEEVTDQYVKYARQLKEMISHGFLAAVYTQTTDVVIEVNGQMTTARR